MAANYSMGIDVGGTFTDFALWDRERKVSTLIKVPSTPSNQAEGITRGIDELACPLDEMERIVHGTTVGTNAILQGKGAKVGLMTTKGFRDLIEIGRTQRLVPNSMFKPKFVRPKPLVPRHLRFEVAERGFANGEIAKGVDPGELKEIGEKMMGEGVESIAICFLHSYRNGENEKEAAALLRNRFPSIPLSLSSEVIPEYREFERFSSTVVNAYLAPVMIHYLESLESELKRSDNGRTFFIMSSCGGMISSKTAQSFPIRTILSGPAGGVNGAIHFSRQAGFRDIITYDMGGTSTDVCLVKDLVPMASSEHQISGIPIKTLQMEINTVGAGGGSVAWVDEDGRLKVGPQSAGADPGPASYGKGAVSPTITDANLFLGRLGAKSLLGGKLLLSPELAQESLQRLSKGLNGLGSYKLAEGILQIAVTKMASAIKEISVERGHDPRDYILVPYGGAGPMHAAQITDELGISTIFVPRFPGNLSALGLILSDVRHDDVRSWIKNLKALSFDGLDREFRNMEKGAFSVLKEEGFESKDTLFRRSLDLRYKGQAFELNIPLRNSDDLEKIAERFHGRFQETYGHSRPGQIVELVNLRLSSFGLVKKPHFPAYASKGRSILHAQKDERQVYFKGLFAETPVYERDLLPCEEGLNGPAIIEENGATTVIPPGWMVKTDPNGNLLLNRRRYG
jgi:N-methylhydantoinase A